MMTAVAQKTKTVALGEIARFIRGITFKPTDLVSQDTDDAVVCMRTKNVQRHLDTSDLISVPASFVKREEQFLQHGDMLVSTANSWELVGKCSWVPKLEYRSTAGGFISILRGDESRVVDRYLYHWLASPVTQHNLRHCGRQTTNISNLDYNRALALQVPLPYPENPKQSLSEQRRIADILDKADAVRQKRRGALRTLDDILQSAFMRLVGPASEEYSKWPKQTIESLAEQKRGSMRTGPFGSDLKHSEFVDEGIAVLGIDNAVHNRFSWDERRYITPGKYEKLERYTVYPQDVIVTIMGTTGRSAVVPDDVPTAITTKHLACITLDRDKAEPEFISNSIHRHPAVLGQIGVSHRGAIMPGLNLTLIKYLELHVPPIELQRQFTRAIEELRKYEGRLADASAESDDLFASLTQRAFRGTL